MEGGREGLNMGSPMGTLLRLCHVSHIEYEAGGGKEDVMVSYSAGMRSNSSKREYT